MKHVLDFSSHFYSLRGRELNFPEQNVATIVAEMEQMFHDENTICDSFGVYETFFALPTSQCTRRIGVS